MASVSGARGGYYYYGWNIVAVCILAAVAANGLTINAFSLFLKSWSAELHAPVSTLSLGIAGCGILCSIAAPFAGMIIDKLPSRGIFATGLIGVALFYLGISVMQKPWQMIALYTLFAPFGIILATSMPANAVVSRWFGRRLGLALGLTAFGLGMGGVIMPPLIAVLMPVLGWRMIWRLAAALVVLLVLPLVIAVLRDRPTEREGFHYLAADGTSTHRPHHGAGGGGGITTRRILGNPNFWVLLIAYLPMLGLYGGVSQNIGPIAASRGVGTQLAGVMLAGLSLAQLAATLLVGLLSDRLGNRLPMAGLGFATALGGLLVALGQNPPTLVLGALLAGCGGAFWPLLAAACSVQFGAGGVGRAFGLLNFFLPLTAFSAFFVAKVQENTASYAPSLLTLAAISTVGGLVCLLFLREPARADRSDDDRAAPETPIVPEFATHTE